MRPSGEADDARTGYELRDHTADIALFVWADSLEALFGTAAEGYYAVIGDLHPRYPGETASLELEATDIDALLHDFLTELLYWFETERVLFSNFTFDRLEDTVLRAAATRTRLDTDASTLDHEVKAVTFHDLNIVERDGRYEVTVILDI